MVLPDGGNEGNQPGLGRPRGLLFGVAAASLVVGILLLGALTAQESPPAAATASTTTTDPVLDSPTTTIDVRTWSVSKIATGDPITWANGVGVGATWPIDLVNFKEQVFLFGSDRPEFGPGPGDGLNMWSSSDGHTWVSHGQVIPAGFSFTSVTADDSGLIALGSSDVDGSPRIWLSENGLDWEVLSLPVQDMAPGFREVPIQVARSGETIVIATATQFDERSLLAGRLPPEYDDLQIEIRPSTRSVIVYGPAGIPILETDVDKLGLEIDDLAPCPPQAYCGKSTIWVRSGGEWSDFAIEDTYLSNLWLLPDGQFAATGWGPNGDSPWISTDGISWDQSSDLGFDSEFLALGPHGVIAASYSSRSPLYYSIILGEWESLGLGEVLPNALIWWYGPVVLNENGIALLAHGYSGRLVSNQPQAASISRDGFELTYRPDLEGLVLSVGEEVWTVPTYSPTLSSLIAVDVPGKTITFLQPQTEEPVATFTFSEITNLEIDAWGGLEPPNQFTAFLHTSDRVNWVVQDLPLIPDNLQFIDMVLTEDQVIVTAIDYFAFAALSSTPNLRILVGDLP